MHPTQKQANPSVVTPALTLRAAATYLDRYGWTQGIYYASDRQGPFAAADVLGAIGMAVYGSEIDCPDLADHMPGWPDFCAAINVLRGYLIAQEPDDYYADGTAPVIGDWNDEADQTADAVIAVLRAAADDWDRIHGGVA